MSENDQTFWKVTLGQGGNKLIAILDDDQWAKLNDALFTKGQTCTMVISENNVLRGVLVVPRQGGMVFNIEQARPVLIMQGQVATEASIVAFQREFQKAHPGQSVPQPTRIEPKDQPRARIVFPAWGVTPASPAPRQQDVISGEEEPEPKAQRGGRAGKGTTKGPLAPPAPPARPAVVQSPAPALSPSSEEEPAAKPAKRAS